MRSNDRQLTTFLLRMADDALIIAHRNSEWTGLGPILEEDIAFSSIAQDKLGHAYTLYSLVRELGESRTADDLAFGRNASAFRCCQLVEYPIGEYDFSLVRHFLVDNAEQIRFAALENSTFEPLSKLARKVRGEIKYHVFHADNWMVQLGSQGTEESRARMQSTLNLAFPLALGMFERLPDDDLLVTEGVYPGEAALEAEWQQRISDKVVAAGFVVPHVPDPRVGYGGRIGLHTEHLAPLLDEMCEVIRIDPSAEW